MSGRIWAAGPQLGQTASSRDNGATWQITSRRRSATEPRGEAMAERPAPVTHQIIETLTPTEGPVRCIGCGHDHWGWSSDREPLLAPQWARCGDSFCSCRTLKVSA